MNQLQSYHSSEARFLTTSKHFLGGDQSLTTARKLAFQNASVTSELQKKSGKTRWGGTLDLTRTEPGQGALGARRTMPSSTYAGNGTFVVELPHSNITYRSLNIKPRAAGGASSGKTEYMSSFVKPGSQAARRQR